MASLFTRWLSALALTLAASASVNAASTVAPVIKVSVVDAQLEGLIDQPIFYVPQASARSLSFGATVTRDPGSPAVDIYLGVIAPGGAVYSWVPVQGGGATLVQGMAPVARSVTDASFNTKTALGRLFVVSSGT